MNTYLSKFTNFFLLFLLIVFVYVHFRNPVFAEEPKWVLKETLTDKFLCSEGLLCVNPGAVINPESATMNFGLASECAAVYEVNAVWSGLPETFKLGESQSTPLTLHVVQNVPCPAAIAEKADVSLAIGKAVPPETANFIFTGAVEISDFPVNGQSKNAETIASWTVPEGKPGEFFYVKIATSLKSGLGGYVTYVYEYRDGSVDKNNTTLKLNEKDDDVCAVGLKKSTSFLPSFIRRVQARDSGARFVDFSGEVTVTPESDSKNVYPADMDMVIETGNIIKTEAESTAIISFADMTTFCMKPFTTVIIDTPPEKESKLRLLVGKVWMNVKKMMQDGTMNVTMNQAVAGIKGTVLVLEENNQESIIKVIDGEVEYTAQKDGANAMVAKGEMVHANQNGLSAKEHFDVESERSNWQEFVLGVQKSDSGASFNGFITIIVIIIIMTFIFTVRKLHVFKRGDE